MPRAFLPWQAACEGTAGPAGQGVGRAPPGGAHEAAAPV